jgi:hypothetical protein
VPGTGMVTLGMAGFREVTPPFGIASWADAEL